MMNVGRVCTKLQGREAGKKCVIVEMVNKNFVMVTGPPKMTGVKRRRCNMKHLEPLEEVIPIEKGVPDEEIERKIKEAGVPY